MSPGNSHLPDLITEPAQLQMLVKILGKEQILGVDTESNSLYAYQEQVCLIQFSTSAADYLVDPLALQDLSPLGRIFADRRIEKVFHAAEYDLICLYRDFDFRFSNLFDTMWAARVAGRKAIGLSSLLAKEFGVKVDKRFQRADWGKRPLPKNMKEYACQDTHYLIRLRNRLKKELESKGRMVLAREDFRRMEKLYQRPLNNGNQQDCWERINGSKDLNPQQMAILRKLCEFRESIAQRRNRPVFKVFSDSTLVSIASACPVSLDELESLPHVSSRQVQRYGSAFLDVVQEGLNAPPLNPEPTPRPDATYFNRMDAVRAWRKREACRLDVESDVILPRDLMQEVVSINPQSMDSLSMILSEVPYRQKHFSESLFRTLRGT